MTSWVSHRRLAAGILALSLFFVSSAALAAVGRTVGTYQVSPSGAATYTIPLWAPRGPNGLQPQIALAYNSQSGSSYLGVGWSLSGISSIYRCPQTYAQDPAPAPVTLTMSDVFCMDGQRLRLTGGTYGEAASTYQTEVANFSNVTAYGSQGNGPSYFEVQGRDGRTYEYGNGGGSQVLASGTTSVWIWYLDKVTDRAGNTMTIAYCTAGNSYCTESGATASGTAVPVTISWTPASHGASSYNYTINFVYSANVPQPSIYGYVGGAAYSNTSLLSSITVEYSGATVKKYALSYGQSPTTGRDELTQVEECADAGQTNCVAPTTFTYQSGQIGVSTSATTVVSSGAPTPWVHNDFRGIGYNDLAYCSGGSPDVIYVVFASTSGYGSPVNTEIPCNNALYGDLTGSGQDGILAQNGTDWWYYTWNGSSFSGQNTGISDSCPVYQCQYVLADVNGDGLPDLISGDLTKTVTDGITSFTYKIYVRLNTTSGSSTVSFSSSNPSWFTAGGPNEYQAVMISNTDLAYGTNSYGTLKALDFNGDGKQDIALETITPSGGGYAVKTYELISGSSSFSSTLITSGSGSSYGATTFLDFNGDGCTDYAFSGTIYISECNGNVATPINVGGNIIGAMDWNGDGYTDILVQNGSTIGVYLSEGDGISSLQATSIPYNSADLYFAFDANGDGLDDLGVFSGSGGISYYLHNGAGQKPDLLSGVTDGYGNYAKPTYVSMAQSVNSIYFEWNDAVFPYQNYIGPLYLVNWTTFSDPSNPPSATYYQRDSYAAAWMNLQGRGFAGFGAHEMYDSRNGAYETWGYDRSFPYTWMLTSDVATQNNTPQETIFDRRYTLTDTVLDNVDNNERYFPYVSSSTVKNYEVGGTENTELIRTNAGSYAYDNYGNLTSATQTITDNDSGSPYSGYSWTTTTTNTPDPDQSTWCLTLLSEQQISYTASDGSPSVTRTRDYTPDTTNCDYTQIQTEPSSGSYEVTEALAYDEFGNINSDTVTGIGMAARATSANWGTTGQFPMSVTDATNATTQFNYNFSYGLVSSETDPNNLTTSWTYGDGFGRLTQETRPDGTYTSSSYTLAGSGNPMTRMIITEQAYGTSGGLITTTTTWLSMIDQLYAKFTTLLDGTTATIICRAFDPLGRITIDEVPYGVNQIGANYYSYDILNRVTQVQRPINQGDSNRQTTSYAYAGDTTTITDPYGYSRTLIHDPNGWLRETEDAVGYAVTLGYDAAGSKISATDNLNNGATNPLWTGTYAYGIAPFLTGETDVDRGTWGYTVDALGERTAWTDSKGQQFHESYDALSRPITRTEPDLFTQWTWGSSAASHNIGKLASVCTGTGTCASGFYSEGETYDSLGRLYQRAITIPGMSTYTYTWQYDSTTGLLSTLTYPVSTSGKALELQYGYQNGILTSITDILDSPNVTVWKADAQNPDGQITEETLGNGLVTNRAYDAVTHWLSSVESGPGGGSSIQNQSFLYDEMGDVTQRQDGNRGLSENFYYDHDYRLSYSTLNGTQNLALNYDGKGNITSRSDVASGASWTYDPVHVHEVTEAGSSGYVYTYDPNGNMTSRQGSSITWTSYNYPNTINDSASGDTVSFSYGPDRLAWFEETQNSSGTELAYHVGGLLDIVSSAGVTDYRHYIYAGNEPVAIDSRKSSGTNAFYYLLSDQEGSIADITNSSGASVVGESFTAYGNRRNPTTWSGAPSGSDLTTIAGITRHGYTFQDVLGQMGLNDMVGRVQDAITGRFLSADPLTPDPTNPQSYNRYSYTNNNPLTYTDPSGFLTVTDWEDLQLPTIFASQKEADLNIRQAGEPAPHHHVAWWWIAGSGKVTA